MYFLSLFFTEYYLVSHLNIGSILETNSLREFSEYFELETRKLDLTLDYILVIFEGVTKEQATHENTALVLTETRNPEQIGRAHV